ncbi:hypothetical protein C8R47DRAFT_1318325 [Mycena vitilis]|nr:hypothetical protein C8R47DRAFT_1318325 [Mycena vitilis]
MLPTFRTTLSRGIRASLGARNASTEASVGTTPGIPPAAQTTRTPTTYMSFAMPDVFVQPSAPRPQIPYLPDFWQSSAKSTPQPPAEPALPKLSVVSDINKVHSHNLQDANTSPDTSSVGPSSSAKGGLLQDISDDLGIPSPKAIKDGVSNLLHSFR